MHQTFIGFYWLAGCGNYLLKVGSFYANIHSATNGNQYSLWRICTSCYWNKMDNYFQRILSKMEIINDNLPLNIYNYRQLHHNYSNEGINFRQIIIAAMNNVSEDNLNVTRWQISQILYYFQCIYFTLFFLQLFLSFFSDVKLNNNRVC